MEPPDELKAFFRDALTVIIIAGVLVAGLQLAAQKFIVDGPSMDSSFRNGQQVLVNTLIYRFQEPERGDIIIFHPPENEKEDYIKRIIGLPGESVEIKEGVIYIHKDNGSMIPLNEPYVVHTARLSFKGDTIPANKYFVLGDNRNNSSDSRNGWTVPFQNIVGKAWLSVWPPNDWGLVVNYLSGQ
ncbi:MAG: signal peptidase I [Dehalococcoidales bacterium]